MTGANMPTKLGFFKALSFEKSYKFDNENLLVGHMSQSIPWLPIPPPPGRLSGIFNCTCSQGRTFAFCWLAPGWGICSAVKSRIFVACFAI